MTAVNPIANSITGKILSLVVLLCFGLLVMASVAIFQMNSIGKELASIAEKDIPLTEAVTLVTNHQLEQAILVEKIIRLSGIKSPKNVSEFEKTKSAIIHLEEQVAEEILKAEKLAEYALAHASTEEEEAEFRMLVTKLESIEHEYALYKHHIDEVLNLIDADELEKAQTLMVDLEKEQERLDHELIALLHEIERFTLAAAQTAEAHEKQALNQIVITAAATFFFSIVVSVYFARNLIAGPLKQVTNGLLELARGNTNVEVSVRNRTKLGHWPRPLKPSGQIPSRCSACRKKPGKKKYVSPRNAGKPACVWPMSLNA